MRVITVVMGAPTTKARNSQVTKLLDYAFNRFTTHKIYDRNEKVTTAEVDKGKKKDVSVVTAEQVSVLTKKGESAENVQKETVTNVLKAPLKKGDQVGKLVLKKDGDILSTTPLAVKEDVPKASWWKLFKRTAGHFGMP
jgi:D-alanyl-D-alanine carboxypeptidase (penicillin-binding protein 5/6)